MPSPGRCTTVRHGQTDGRDFQQQMSRASCLVLILAAIIYWQIQEIETVLRHWDPEADGINPALLPHLSPIGWENVVLYGEYHLDRDPGAPSLAGRWELRVENSAIPGSI